MQKLLLATLVLAAVSVQADFWDNCTAYGGTIITANSYGNDKGGLCNDPNDSSKTNNCNGKRFCWGPNAGINWWTAFTWCESIGGKLASQASACPGSQTGMDTSCPNMYLKRNGTGGWLSTTHATSSKHAMMIWGWGTVESNSRDQQTNNRRALCEEK